MLKQKKVKHEPDIAEMTEDVEYLLAGNTIISMKDKVLEFGLKYKLSGSESAMLVMLLTIGKRCPTSQILLKRKNNEHQ